MFRINLILALLATSSHAFAPSLLSYKCSTTSLNAGLTAAELESIISKGHVCEKGECTVSEVDELLGELMEQQHILNERVMEINNMIKSLEILNGSDNREVNEIRETVRAIFRVFQMSAKGSDNDYPSLSRPTGFSGDVGSGPTDAYKALNPKPWKPSP
jgi:hypothetical protein